MFFHKLLPLMLLPLLISSPASAGLRSNSYHQDSPWIDAHGGPDAYGYTWIDSDEPGGPTYQWIDITGIGTQVTGLSDDNYVGPFDLGFDFDYYWYTVSEVYIGSNGYLKVPPPYNICQSFPSTIPLVAPPNDFIAGYVMDLWVTAGAEVYYYTNDVDTFITSFINVPCWTSVPPGYTGSHTFQIILDGVENTIRVNYGTQVGLASNNDILIGIENINGQVGLLHSADTYIPHNNYTVVFYRPDSTGYSVTDMAVSGVMNPGSKGTFILEDTTYTPVAYIKNTGNQVLSGGTAYCRIYDEDGDTLYYGQYALGTLNPGVEIQITFTNSWTPPTTGAYSVLVRCRYTGDMNPNNNVIIGELEVVDIPGELAFDDGSYSSTTWWIGGGGGFGVQFVPPVYPAQITMIRFFVGLSDSPPDSFKAMILDDDGPAGGPGTTLFEQNVVCNVDTSWYILNTNVTINDGSFFVGWLMLVDSIAMGIDDTPPISRNTWELTGGWAPYRDQETSEAMIRCMIGQGAIPSPLLAVSADSINFGTVFIGDTVSQDLILYNIGTLGDLIISDILMTGVPPNLIFQLIGFTPNTHIAPGDSLELEVQFHPVIPITSTALLTISSNSIAGTEFVYLTGTGQALPSVIVTLIPENPPIQIPAIGGSFNFTINLENTTSLQNNFQFWTMATLPNGQNYGPILGPVNVSLPPNGSGSRLRTQFVPGSAPTGNYTYHGYAGTYPNVIIDQDSFPFTKLPGEGKGIFVQGWTNWGEPFANEPPSTALELPLTHLLLSAYPNPFNPQTTISFNLPEAGEVSLIAYDVLGREMAMLFNGFRDAGFYEITWNAENLPSGIYFVRLSVVGGQSAVQKLMLMK